MVHVFASSALWSPSVPGVGTWPANRMPTLSAVAAIALNTSSETPPKTLTKS